MRRPKDKLVWPATHIGKIEGMAMGQFEDSLLNGSGVRPWRESDRPPMSVFVVTMPGSHTGLRFQIEALPVDGRYQLRNGRRVRAG
jgi:hypothetical protein